ncbi:allophanate hydrolase [Desulfobulbus rhabdoformis]|uniref:allophanate hydrolase n=1 Tax=Desulfobulbus rhabdoformis TaxID=34032 RepID=UPI0019641D29|nr:allophanate hydrolase [Desulfobulbus rhabdoformis]MBM9615600.1 allophanate hydrolase [Desulfobulbus rhabdoformis]
MQLDIAYLQSCYRKGSLTPTQLIAELRAACQKADPTIWIYLLTEEELTPYLERLARATMEELPLYGIPFAIKDNIDFAGVPTTAACPEYSYLPQQSATVVQLLVDAGAIPLGKTNLDQFATGLVGTRSPYGGCTNSFDPDYISGGSSSGSAVAVAKGLCSFALGTDTAGSGRVPAAFNNLIGLKPSKGLISTQGVVPACRSLDCVSIFALCTGDAETVLQVAAQPDAGDPYSRQITHSSGKYSGKESCIFGVPQEDQLQFFGNATYEQAYHQAVARLEAIGGSKRVIDLQPFLDAAKLLYEGPWVAERTAAVGGFLADHPEAGYPVTRKIICESNTFSAVDCFQAQYRLQAFKATTDRVLNQLDCLVLPTAGTCYTIKEVEENPIALNSNLGTYTNFMNLLDYCGIAVPTALTESVPFGVTLVGEAFGEERLLALAARLHEASNLPMGTGWALPPQYRAVEASDRTLLMVCGAHLQGLPLHFQLEELNAYLVERTTTAPNYRMFALETQPPKPGLVRDTGQGAAIEVEVYSIPLENLGPFVAQIPHPLGIGKVELDNRTWVTGFIAEPVVMEEGREITELGGWRKYLATK